jgi:hypothetical protein
LRRLRGGARSRLEILRQLREKSLGTVFDRREGNGNRTRRQLEPYSRQLSGSLRRDATHSGTQVAGAFDKLLIRPYSILLTSMT